LNKPKIKLKKYPILPTHYRQSKLDVKFVAHTLRNTHLEDSLQITPDCNEKGAKGPQKTPMGPEGPKGPCSLHRS